MAVTAPLAGDLIDRHGPRRLLATGLGLVALGMGLTSIAHEPWHVLVAFGSIAGLGFGMVGANALFAAVGFTSMGVIETHFLPYATFCGFSTITAASAFGFLSGINLVGILVAGWRSDRTPRPTPLAVIYGLRGFTVILLMFVAGDPRLLYLVAGLFGLLDYASGPVVPRWRRAVDSDGVCGSV